MAYVVAEPCIQCKYTDCVEVCPVECFHEGPNFLAIDPDECIDCGACVPVCPTQAIFPKGSKLLGGAIGDQNERIQVAFDRIILPDNKEVEFDGSALDENGALGIKGKVDREKTKRMSAGAGRVLSGAASGILDAVTGGSVAGQALNSGGQEAVDLTSNEVDFNNQAATVVRLQKDAPIKVYVKRSF